MEKISLQDSVEIYGTGSQKEAFQKRNGTLPSKQLLALIRTLEQHYKFVEEDGKGKKKIFLCDCKFDEVQERKDDRSDNGRKFEFLDTVKSLIIKYLKTNEIFEENQFYHAMSKFLVELKMVDSKFRLARSSSKIASSFRNQLVEKEILEEGNKYFVEYYLDNEFRTLSKVVGKALSELEEEGLVIRNNVQMGAGLKVQAVHNEIGSVLIDKNGEPVFKSYYSHKPLTQEQIRRVAEIDRELLNEFDLKKVDIIRYSFSKKVKDYKKAQKEAYRKFGVDYHYKAITAYLIGSEKELEKYYVEDFDILSDLFKRVYIDYSKEKAVERQNKIEETTSFGETEYLENTYKTEMRARREYVQSWEKMSDSFIKGLNLVIREESKEDLLDF